METLEHLTLSEEKLRLAGMRGLAGSSISGQAERVKELIDGTGLLVAREGFNPLIRQLAGPEGAKSIGAQLPGYAAGNVAALLGEMEEKISRQLDDILAGSLPEESVNTSRLAYGAVTEEKIADGAVSPEKLEEKYYTQEEILSPATREALGALPDCVPDEAFLALYIGAGKYGFRLSVTFSEGTPLPGKLVSGLLTVGGLPLYTDEEGKCLGVSTSPTPTITMDLSDYMGAKNVSQRLESTSKITQIAVPVLNASPASLTIAQSKTIKLSPAIRLFDVALVAGGEGGGVRGGNGGEIKNVFDLPYVQQLSVLIGAAGLGGGDSSGFPAPTLGGKTEIPSLSLSTGTLKNGGLGATKTANGGDRSLAPFEDPAIRCSGGGAGGGYLYYKSSGGNELTPAGKAGASFGGAGGEERSRPGKNATGYGGGGGGGFRQKDSYTSYPENGDKGGNGYQGVAFFRWRYQQE